MYSNELAMVIAIATFLVSTADLIIWFVKNKKRMIIMIRNVLIVIGVAVMTIPLSIASYFTFSNKSIQDVIAQRIRNPLPTKKEDELICFFIQKLISAVWFFMPVLCANAFIDCVFRE